MEQFRYLLISLFISPPLKSPPPRRSRPSEPPARATPAPPATQQTPAARLVPSNISKVNALAVSHHAVIQRINKAFPASPPWGTGDGSIDPGQGILLSLVDRWNRDPTFRAAQQAARLVNQRGLDPPVAMMGYDNRPMSTEYARRPTPPPL